MVYNIRLISKAMCKIEILIALGLFNDGLFLQYGYKLIDIC